MKKALSVGSLTLDGTRPRVALVVDRPLSMAQAGELGARGVDLFEVRVDLFETSLDQTFDYIAKLRNEVGLPLLGTVRETEANRAHRPAIFERLIPLVDAVDIEVDTPIRDELIELARERTIILSEHDFDAMPDDSALDRLVEQTLATGADILKVAGAAQCSEDVARLLTYCRACPVPMIAIAMGSHGMVSRVVAPLFGSLFSYTFIGTSVAPGQVGLDELVCALKRYYPQLSD